MKVSSVAQIYPTSSATLLRCMPARESNPACNAFFVSVTKFLSVPSCTWPIHMLLACIGRYLCNINQCCWLIMQAAEPAYTHVCRITQHISHFATKKVLQGGLSVGNSTFKGIIDQLTRRRTGTQFNHKPLRGGDIHRLKTPKSVISRRLYNERTCIVTKCRTRYNPVAT